MKPQTQVDKFMSSTVNPKGSVLDNELRNITRTCYKNKNKNKKKKKERRWYPSISRTRLRAYK